MTLGEFPNVVILDVGKDAPKLRRQALRSTILPHRTSTTIDQRFCVTVRQ